MKHPQRRLFSDSVFAREAVRLLQEELILSDRYYRYRDGEPKPATRSQKVKSGIIEVLARLRRVWRALRVESWEDLE